MHRLYARVQRPTAPHTPRVRCTRMALSPAVGHRSCRRELSLFNRFFRPKAAAAASVDAAGAASTTAGGVVSTAYPFTRPFPFPNAARLRAPAAGTKGSPAPAPAAAPARDEFDWLADQHSHGAAIVTYLQTENKYVDTVLGASSSGGGGSAKSKSARGNGSDPTAESELRLLFEEMSDRIPVSTERTVPERVGPYEYYERRDAGTDFPMFCRRHIASGSGEEEVVLNVNRLFDHFPYINIGMIRFSPDHRFIAFTLDSTGSEHYTLFVKELTPPAAPAPAGSVGGGRRTKAAAAASSEDELARVIHRFDGVNNFEWMNDSQTIIYTATDALSMCHSDGGCCAATLHGLWCLERPSEVRVRRVTDKSSSAPPPPPPPPPPPASNGIVPPSYTRASAATATATSTSSASSAATGSADAVNSDPVLYSDSDPSFYIDIRFSKDRHFCIISSHSKTTTELRVLPCSDAALRAVTGGGVDAAALATRAPLTTTPSAINKTVLVAARATGTEYYIEHHAGMFYLGTNADGAKNYKLIRAPVERIAAAAAGAGAGAADAGSTQRWQTVLPARADTRISEIEIYANHFVVFEKTGGLPRIRVQRYPATNDEPTTGEAAADDFHYVKLPHPVGVVAPGANTDFGSSALRFTFSSPLVPEQTYDYDLTNKTLVRRNKLITPTAATPAASASSAVSSDSAAAKLRCYRVMVPSQTTVTDPITGESRSVTTNVPLTIVHSKDWTPGADGATPRPLLFRSYGAYGTDVDLSYHEPYLSLLARGWTIAYAHIRGGSEYGFDWHAAGRLNHKQNSITDLMSCAAYLIERGFTTRELMCAYTASAGALTLAAAINTAPDLFQAAVMKVPFVDPISSMLDDSQPLTAHEIDEWGDPARNANDYNYLLSYSPYQNLPAVTTGSTASAAAPPAAVAAADATNPATASASPSTASASASAPPQYPHMLITSSMNDPRVPYWQPAKYVARLRAANPNNFILFQTSFDSGHFDEAGRYSRLQVFSLEWLFLLRAVGMPIRSLAEGAGGWKYAFTDDKSSAAAAALNDSPPPVRPPSPNIKP